MNEMDFKPTLRFRLICLFIALAIPFGVICKALGQADYALLMQSPSAVSLQATAELARFDSIKLATNSFQ